MEPVALTFVSGTIEIRNASEETPLAEPCTWDERVRAFRAPGMAYAPIVRELVRQEIPYRDDVPAYGELDRGLVVTQKPRPYQKEALDAWLAARGRGVVVLPTGAGKTLVGVMAIDRKRRDALVIAPTLDLVRQWHDVLSTRFGREIGVIGGGEYRVEPITVTTYDSAYLHMEHLGRRFGTVIFDECHHLPSETYALSAQLSIAPFRLGLTATPERADGLDHRLASLIGPTVCRHDIVEMSGEYLADYETISISVELSDEERREYDDARRTYRQFIMSQGIRLGSPSGWGEFIKRSAWSDEGRRAMESYQKQRNIAFGAPAKLAYVEHLLHRHRIDRTIVFTQDNRTAYEISRRMLVPVITHQTKVSERSEILKRFAEGTYRAVATSKVLNEGVDVPDANVAIVVSGSGSVREHVQRLGRILRKKDGKQARLYELVTARTTEQDVSQRRREHSAYR